MKRKLREFTSVLKIIFGISITFMFHPNINFAEEFHFLTSVTGDNIGDEFYKIALGSGDVNGDGYQDVLIGAPDGIGGGYAKLFFGSAEFDTTDYLLFHCETDPYDFGYSCAIVGDVNGDGYDDILISDPRFDEGIHLECDGRAYLYFGGEDMDAIPDLTFFGENCWSWFGLNVSPAGDVNSDGYDDWLIGTPYDGIISPLGHICLYFGGEEPDSICDLYFEGGIAEQLQFNTPCLGDINGDEYDDLLFFGIRGLRIHLGASNPDTIPDLAWSGPLSHPIGGIGDVNNDGYNDWCVGVGGYPGFNFGFWLFFGWESPDTIPDLLFEPEPPCTSFYQDAVGGDIDGDGIDDIVIGGFINGYYDNGQVLGYLGGTDIDNHYDYFFDSGIPNECLGIAVGLTDINGDSIFEVLAGGVGEGRGRVWFLTTQEVYVAPSTKRPVFDFALHTPYPNPFNPVTNLRFDLPVAGEVSLVIYDVQGRVIAILIDGFQPAGIYQRTFDASDLSSGVYFARLQAEGFSQTRKLLFIK